MSRIGFKTEKMKSDERMPVVYANPDLQKELTEDQILELRIKMKVRTEAIKLIDHYLEGRFFDQYLVGELKNLKKMYDFAGKDLVLKM